MVNRCLLDAPSRTPAGQAAPIQQQWNVHTKSWLYNTQTPRATEKQQPSTASAQMGKAVYKFTQSLGLATAREGSIFKLDGLV